MSPKLLWNLMTLGRLGHAKPGPGTVGSIATAAVVYWPFAALPGLLDLVLVVALCAGCAVVLILADPQDDDSRIVIDEAAGVSLALYLAHSSFTQALLALFFFRILDILKPGPIRTLERWQPPWLGIYADDMAAGLGAGVLAIVAMKVLWLVGI